MKRALVLAGGGVRGAFQVGMLRELVINQGLDFHVIRGVSVGALNAAFLAQASTAGNSLANLQQKVEELHQLWTTEIRGNNSVYKERLGMAGLTIGADSIYSLAPLRRLIDKYLSAEALRLSGRDFAVGAVSLVSGFYKEWAPDDARFIERIIASASIPVVFPFVNFRDERDAFVDGGVRNITPLSSVFRTKPDEVYVLLTSRLLVRDELLPESSALENDYARWNDNLLGTRVGGLDVLKRTVELLTDEIYLDDLRGALRWNSVAESAQKLQALAATPGNLSAPALEAVNELARRLADAGKHAVKISVIAPQNWFGKENAATEFSPQLINEAIAHGEQIAKSNVLRSLAAKSGKT
jgi:NTE family protein